MSNERLTRHLFQAVGYRRLVPYVEFAASPGVPARLRTVRLVHDLVALDRDVRQVMMRSIDVIEAQVKGQSARAFLEELGPACLSDPANFKHLKDHRKTLGAMGRDLARQGAAAGGAGGAPGGGVPVQEAIEAASLSTVVRLLDNVRGPAVAGRVADSFSANRRCLSSWLKTVNSVRDACAHFGPYVVREQIPSVPKPVYGVDSDSAAPLYALYVVERLLRGRAEAGTEEDARDLRELQDEASRVVGRFAWRYPGPAVRLRIPAPYVERFADPLLPKVRLVAAARPACVTIVTVRLWVIGQNVLLANPNRFAIL